MAALSHQRVADVLNLAEGRLDERRRRSKEEEAARPVEDNHGGDAGDVADADAAEQALSQGSGLSTDELVLDD